MDRLNLPRRSGPAPRTHAAMPHRQEDQNAPPALQTALIARIADLPGVRMGPSGVSVPGARGFHLSHDVARGPAEAFMAGREFAHVHPPDDGSLHLRLPAHWADEVVQQGWGEPHPLAGMPGGPANLLMVYGPRDADELEIVGRIVRAAYEHAAGQR